MWILRFVPASPTRPCPGAVSRRPVRPLLGQRDPEGCVPFPGEPPQRLLALPAHAEAAVDVGGVEGPGAALAGEGRAPTAGGGFGEFLLVRDQDPQGIGVGIPRGELILVPRLDPEAPMASGGIPAGRLGAGGKGLCIAEQEATFFVFDPDDEPAAEPVDLGQEGSLGETGIEEEDVDPGEGFGEAVDQAASRGHFRLAGLDGFEVENDAGVGADDRGHDDAMVVDDLAVGLGAGGATAAVAVGGEGVGADGATGEAVQGATVEEQAEFLAALDAGNETEDPGEKGGVGGDLGTSGMAAGTDVPEVLGEQERLGEMANELLQEFPSRPPRPPVWERMGGPGFFFAPYQQIPSGWAANCRCGAGWRKKLCSSWAPGTLKERGGARGHPPRPASGS